MSKIQTLQEKIAALQVKIDVENARQALKIEKKEKSAWLLVDGKWKFDIPSSENTASFKWNKADGKYIVYNAENLPEVIPMNFIKPLNHAVKTLGYVADFDQKVYKKA